MKNLSKMGFHESVVPQVLDGKTSTWRLKDHKFKKGDIVAFENSQTREIFGFGKIVQVVVTTIGKINIKDKKHYRTYKDRKELIGAFKKYNPDYEIDNDAPVFVYVYEFKKNLE